MNKYLALFSISVLLFSGACSDNSKKTETANADSTSNIISNSYKPKYDTVWQKVDDYVRNSWPTTSKKADDLPFVFSSIGPSYNYIFYWDCYFTNAGLLIHGKDTLAKGTAGNLLYLTEKIGFVPNASRAWGMNRSQPAYLSLMVKDIYDHMQEKDTAWLRKSFYTLKKEYQFWMNENNTIEDHKTTVEGLVRFSHHASKKDMLDFYPELVNRFGFPKDVTEEEKIKVSSPFIAEAASGWDFTPRFEGRCPDFIALDLNTNLYTYEKNFSWMTKELNIKGERDWDAAAEKRKTLINKYCWNESRGMYMDYDFVNNRHSKIASVLAFQPLMAGLASKEQAEKTVANLKIFENEWGVAPVEQSEQKLKYQWDYPTEWPPLQFIAFKGLDQYGYTEDAKRIASKYLDVVSKNYLQPEPAAFAQKKVVLGGTEGERKRVPGKIYEKYNVVKGIINDAEYPSNEFLGWSAGVYVAAYDYMKKK